MAAKVICHPAVGALVGRVHGDKIRCGDIVVDTSERFIRPQTKASLFWGIYEGAELRLIEKYLPANYDVVELGSSLGIVGCNIRRKLEPSRRLICVEANPEFKACIERNLALNGASANTTVQISAIDYHPSGREFVSFTEGETTVAGHVAADTGEGTGVKVPATTLARLLREQNYQEYSLVCDIEGAEVGLALREAEALSNCRWLIAELHSTSFQGQSYQVQDLQKLFEERCGFQTRAVSGNVYAFERIRA